MNGLINLELIADGVKVTSTGMTEVVVNLMNTSLDDVLNQISIEDVIDHYSTADLLAELEGRLNEND